MPGGMTFKDMLKQNDDRARAFQQEVAGWMDSAYGKNTEWLYRFGSDPATYAKIVMQHLLDYTGAATKMSPSYRTCLLKIAPAIALQQEMQSISDYGHAANAGPGEGFPDYLKNWFGGGAGNNPGFGMWTADVMRERWPKFVNRYSEWVNSGQPVTGSLASVFGNMTEDELQAFHEMALTPTMSPFGRALSQRYLDQMYTNWKTNLNFINWTDLLKNYTGGIGFLS